MVEVKNLGQGSTPLSCKHWSFTSSSNKILCLQYEFLGPLTCQWAGLTLTQSIQKYSFQLFVTGFTLPEVELVQVVKVKKPMRRQVKMVKVWIPLVPWIPLVLYLAYLAKQMSAMWKKIASYICKLHLLVARRLVLRASPKSSSIFVVKSRFSISVSLIISCSFFFRINIFYHFVNIQCTWHQKRLH